MSEPLPDDSQAKTVPKWARWLFALFFALFAIALYNVIIERFPEKDKEARSAVRDWAKEAFPEAADEAMASYGVFEGHGLGARRLESGAAKMALLAHGLDEPGKLWMCLAPALEEAGVSYSVFRYPNDQSVEESAELMAASLRDLRALGVERLAIVAHSLGGLVSREALTSPTIGYSALLASDQAPQVELLVMIGTPNAGSPLARFRGLLEWRDQLYKLGKGEAHFLGWVFDGAGEAKIDLAPGSAFLNALNARPHPKGVELMLIGGRVCPWRADDIDEQLWERAPELASAVAEIADGVGDGCVSLDSLRLPGAPEPLLVDGSHLSMIRNIDPDSERIPPAVPIVVERLRAFAGQ